MLDLLHGKKGPRFLQLLQDGGVGLVVPETRELSGLAGHAPLAVNRHDGLETVLLADEKVLGAVPRRRMHAAGSGLQRHVVAQNDQGLPFHEGMPRRHIFEIPAGQGPQNLVIGDPRRFHHVFHKLRREDIALLPAFTTE
jgi:hypothetical protein